VTQVCVPLSGFDLGVPKQTLNFVKSAACIDQKIPVAVPQIVNAYVI